MLLFNIILFNSCQEDNIVSSDPNTTGKARIKTFSEKFIVDSNLDNNNYYNRKYEMIYKENLIKFINISSNGNIEHQFSYFYNQNNKIEKVITTYKGVCEDESIVINFQYQNNNLTTIESVIYERNFKTNYKYVNNQISEIIVLSYQDGILLDSSIYSGFENGRPTFEKHYTSHNKIKMSLVSQQKNVFQNGNLIEEFLMKSNTTKWLLNKKYYFDLSKDNPTSNFNEFIGAKGYVTLYLPKNYNKNLLIKCENYSLICNDEVLNDVVVFSAIDYLNVINTKGLIEKTAENRILLCPNNDTYYNTEFTYTWE